MSVNKRPAGLQTPILNFNFGTRIVMQFQSWEDI